MTQHGKCSGWGALLLAPLVLLALAGCGGGSGGSSGTTATGARAALDVYVTDGFSDAYKQVLVTLYKIELTTDGTTYQTVYSSATGTTLDLSSLASTADLLASVSVPAGTYTQARVTFGDHITLVAQDGTSTSVAVDPSLGTDANGQIAITVPTPTRAQSGQTSALLVDFKLAQFTLAGNVLRPQIGCGGDGDIGGKHRAGDLRGAVANLTASGFTLTGPDGRTVTVALATTTTLSDGAGGALTLANGQTVAVEGAFDPASRTITATSVTLDTGMATQHPHADGTVASVDTTAASFVLTVKRADGFQPTGGTITVLTDANTRFDKGPHQTGSLADVTAGSDVHVDGAFDVATQTLTARSVGFAPPDPH